MNKCLKCNNEIPSSILIDGINRNLQNRKYCLVCSPFKKHNTKKLIYNDLICICKYCNKSYPYNNRKKGYTKTICNSCNMSLKRFKLKKKMIDYKGGKCSVCGYYSLNWRNLAFHHVDNNKDFEIADTAYTKSFDEIKRELDKCILVCHLCHNDIHYEKEKHIKEKMLEDGLLS